MSKSKTRSTTSPKLVPGDLAQMRRAPVHPGEVFRVEVREPLKVSQAEAARRLGLSNNMLNMIEVGKRPVSIDVAVRLQALTGVSAEFWATLQMRHDLWHAMQEAKQRRAAAGGAERRKGVVSIRGIFPLALA